VILAAGEKILVVTRPLFPGDLRRQFVGEVLEVAGPLARVCGFSFIFDDTINEFVRRDDVRVRIISLVDAGLTIVLLPEEISVPAVRSEVRNGERWITDGGEFSMNTSALTAHR
jgi:hypothetical protein